MNNYSLKWIDGFILDIAGCVITPRGGAPLQDLGCANGMPNSWFDQFEGMKKYEFDAARCLTRYVVPEAGVTYTIDSSD